MKKDKTLITAMFMYFSFFLCALVICAVALTDVFLSKPQQDLKYGITDKYELQGKLYINIQIEVSPEEYIGYDIGDEYEFVKEN